MGASNNFSILILLQVVLIVSACSSGGGDDEDNEQIVTVASASRCGVWPVSEVNDPVNATDNCRFEAIAGTTYETDQPVIHLFGTSPAAEEDGCPEPGLTLGGPVCTPTLFPIDYRLSWINESNGVSGTGDARLQQSGIAIFGPLRWRSYDSFDFNNTAIETGIPLNMGPNRIEVTTTNSGLIGSTQVTVTRVLDVTPPTVFRVDPEPDETRAFASRIEVYFDEQIDPASLVGAISVFDSMAQPVSGSVEYSALRLRATWRPDTDLDPASTYTARVTGITDLAPNVMLAPFEWSFTTRP